MHEFICRTFFYVLTFMFLNTAFGSWPDFQNPALYFTHYGPRFFSWIAVFEAGYQALRYLKERKAIENARTAELPVPETNKLDRP